MFNIEVIDRGEEFVCSAHNSLLTGMEYQQKKAIQVGCRGGGCGVCKIRILSGEFTTKKMSTKHITSRQAALGYALSCRVFPASDMRIESNPQLSEEITENFK